MSQPVTTKLKVVWANVEVGPISCELIAAEEVERGPGIVVVVGVPPGSLRWATADSNALGLACAARADFMQIGVRQQVH